MTTRAAIVDRITDRIQFLMNYPPDLIVLDKPLLGQGFGHMEIDNVDLIEIAMAIEDEFDVERPFDIPLDSTVDTIADLVMDRANA